MTFEGHCKPSRTFLAVEDWGGADCAIAGWGKTIAWSWAPGFGRIPPPIAIVGTNEEVSPRTGAEPNPGGKVGKGDKKGGPRGAKWTLPAGPEKLLILYTKNAFLKNSKEF